MAERVLLALLFGGRLLILFGLDVVWCKTRVTPIPFKLDNTQSHRGTDQTSSRTNHYAPSQRLSIKSDPSKWTSEESLSFHLLSQDNLKLRPSQYNEDQKVEPVNVRLKYSLSHILGLEQQTETMHISGWFTISWNDPRLSWDPKDHSNLTYVQVLANKLWHPDVGVFNSRDSENFDFSLKPSSRLKVNYTGEVTWLHGAILNVICVLDVSYFPFDYQTCYIIITPWVSTVDDLIITPVDADHIVENSFMPNSNISEWEVIKTRYVAKKYHGPDNLAYQYLELTIHLKRQPLYFVVLVLLPFSMLSALASLIFTLEETGDRLSVALSLVLSMTMYVVIVSTNAPRSMRNIPVMGVFLLGQLGLLSIATVLAVINNKLTHSHGLHSWRDCVFAISGSANVSQPAFGKKDHRYSGLSTSPPRQYFREFVNFPKQPPRRVQSECEHYQVKRENGILYSASNTSGSGSEVDFVAQQNCSHLTSANHVNDVLANGQACRRPAGGRHPWPCDTEVLVSKAVVSALSQYHRQQGTRPDNVYRKNGGRQRDESPTILAARLAVSAVSEAFASQAQNRQPKHLRRRDRRRLLDEPAAHEMAFASTMNREMDEQYPYRRLAAALDCIEMFLYLLLSAFNATVCLFILPRYRQSDDIPDRKDP